MSHTDTTFYVQIKPRLNNSGTVVFGASAVGLTQSRPRAPKGGTVTVKLTVRIPDGAFLPLRPEAVVVVPEDMVTVNLPVEVEAQAPAVAGE